MSSLKVPSGFLVWNFGKAFNTMCVVCAAEVKVNLFPVHSGYLVSMQIVASEVSGSTNRLFKHKAQFNSVRSAFERRTCAWRGFAWRLVIIQRGRLYRGCITIFSSGADRRQLEMLDCVRWIAPTPPPPPKHSLYSQLTNEKRYKLEVRKLKNYQYWGHFPKTLVGNIWDAPVHIHIIIIPNTSRGRPKVAIVVAENIWLLLGNVSTSIGAR